MSPFFFQPRLAGLLPSIDAPNAWTLRLLNLDCHAYGRDNLPHIYRES